MYGFITSGQRFLATGRLPPTASASALCYAYNNSKLSAVGVEKQRKGFNLFPRLMDMLNALPMLEEDTQMTNSRREKNGPADEISMRDEALTIGLDLLEDYVDTGRISDIEDWVRASRTIRDLSPETLSLINSVDVAVERVDMDQLKCLVLQARSAVQDRHARKKPSFDPTRDE